MERSMTYSEGVEPEPETAGYDLNIDVEPALLPNIRAQVGNATESAAAQIDVVRLLGRAPALARGFVGRVIMGTGVDHLDDGIFGGAAVRVVVEATLRDRP